MGIETTYSHGEIDAIVINGIPVETEDLVSWYVPKSLLIGCFVNEIPDDVTFDICYCYADGFASLDTEPYSINKVCDDKVIVTVNSYYSRKHWEGDIDLDAHVEFKKNLIISREKEIGDVQFVSLKTYGDDIFIEYIMEINAKMIEDVVYTAESVIGEIEETSACLSTYGIKNINDNVNEKEFCIHTILPILRRLGFVSVRYNHGNREFGKDITFARRTEFDELENWAIQVKFGDVSGGADSDIDMIVSQADDAFKMPFDNLYTRQREYISKLVIAISGRFTNNAIEKALCKIENSSTKNNIVFLDCDRLNTIIDRLRHG